MEPYHAIEATIRYLTTSEGGTEKGVASGCRGQFHYDDDDHDGFQYFPDLDPNEFVNLGEDVRARIRFCEDRWNHHHSTRIYQGMPFEIREGRKVVGRGVVTDLEADD